MEFVLQKYGENHGRSISSPSLEIPSGNYRLLGCCPYPGQNIEVRIDRNSPTINTRQKNDYRADARGFIEILPYGELAVGTWQIRCYGDLLEEFAGQGWQADLQLTVYEKAIDPLARLEDLIANEIEPFLPQPDYREVIELQFVNTETNSSFVFDLSLPSEKASRTNGALALPDPATMTKPLRRSSSHPSLPPKLTHSNPCPKAPRLPSIPRSVASRDQEMAT
jgi:hypothetical protein